MGPHIWTASTIEMEPFFSWKATFKNICLPDTCISFFFLHFSFIALLKFTEYYISKKIRLETNIANTRLYIQESLIMFL